MSTEVKSAFPLAWPVGQPRTRNPEQARFDRNLPFGRARDELIDEVRLIGGTRPILSTNIEVRSDGLPYAGRGQPRDPGVAIYFHRKGKQVVIACDRYTKIEHNLRACAKTLEAMRGIERWGSSSLLDRAFIGMTALPAPEQDNWEAILGVDRSWRLDAIEERYRERMKEAHPDRGGTDARAQRLNWAIAQARKSKESP